MVFQSYALYPHMTIEENMGFALKIKNQKVKSTVPFKSREMLNLTPLLQRFPKDYQEVNVNVLLWDVRLSVDQKYFYLMNLYQIWMQNVMYSESN